MKSGIVGGLFGLIAAGVIVAGPPEAEMGKRRDRERGEDHGKRRGGTPGERKDFFESMLQRLDEDKNGAISFAEFSKAGRVSRLSEEQRRRLFDRLDKNKDGKIRRNDIPRKEPGGRPWDGRREGNLDTNKDGKVSLDEFRKSPRMAEVPPARQEEIFRKMDRNGDGFLNGEDFRNRRPGHPGGGKRPGGVDHPPRGPQSGTKLIEELDTDGNGALSFREFRRSPRVKQMDEDRQEDLFEKMDRDDDGVLQSDELNRPTDGPSLRPGQRKGPGNRPKGKGQKEKG